MSEQRNPLTEERKALERMTCRGLIAVTTIFLVIRFAPFLWDKLSPFIVCIPIAAVLQPVVRFNMRRLHMKHSIACVIPVLVLLVVFCILVYWFVSLGVHQVNGFLDDPMGTIEPLITSLTNSVNQLLAKFDTMSPAVRNWLEGSMNQGATWLRSQGTALVAWLFLHAANLPMFAVNAFIYLNFLFVGLFLITKDYGEIRAMLPGGRAHDPNSNTSQLTKAGITGAMGFLRVQTIYAILSITAGWIYFTLFHYEYAWLIALVAAILEFLPLFGNGTIYIPWSILAFIFGNPREGTIVIALYLVLITIRRTTEPKIMSQSFGVSPLTSLIGMFIGLRMGGLLGLIGGPIVMTIFGAVYHGHYLNGIRKDIRTLISYCRKRWDYVEPKPYTPPDAPLEDAPEGKNAKPAHFIKRKKKK